MKDFLKWFLQRARQDLCPRTDEELMAQGTFFVPILFVFGVFIALFLGFIHIVSSI